MIYDLEGLQKLEKRVPSQTVWEVYTRFLRHQPLAPLLDRKPLVTIEASGRPDPFWVPSARPSKKTAAPAVVLEPPPVLVSVDQEREMVEINRRKLAGLWVDFENGRHAYVVEECERVAHQLAMMVFKDLSIRKQAHEIRQQAVHLMNRARVHLRFKELPMAVSFVAWKEGGPSSAAINDQIYVDGDLLPDGVRIKRIGLKGIEVEYMGEAFTVPVGWE
jgi:hypothetical protein